jgi:hypothetical protein
MIKEDDFTIPKHTLFIFHQMCREIRVSCKKIDFNKTEWYLKHSWTNYKQNKFINWLTNYLFNNKEARQEIVASPSRKSKKFLRKVATEFILVYGWKIKK